MSKILKRTGAAFFINDTGETVPEDGQLVIDYNKYQLYARSDDTITAIANGDLTYNDGNEDLILSDAIDHLKGFQYKPKTDDSGHQVASIQKVSGKDFKAVSSHDFTKKCSWYSESVRVTGETLTLDTGLIYDFSNDFLIDLTSGLNPREDEMLDTYKVIIYDDGVELSSGYTIDYENGKVTLGSAPSGVITADYSYANGSAWILRPDSGKILKLEHAELDFTLDVSFQEVYFQIWVYNPSDLPNKMMVDQVTYKGFKDVLKIANDVQTVPPLGNITNSVLRAVFDYASTINLLDSIGMELRIATKNDAVMSGEFGSITLYTISEDE